MSGDEKIGSRYCHVAWHDSQLSKMSCSRRSSASHSAAAASSALMNGDARMDSVLTKWSSSSIWISSTPPTTNVPVSLYGRIYDRGGAEG